MRQFTVWMSPTAIIKSHHGDVSGKEWIGRELERLGDNYFDKVREDGFLSIWTNKPPLPDSNKIDRGARTCWKGRHLAAL